MKSRVLGLLAASVVATAAFPAAVAYAAGEHSHAHEHASPAHALERNAGHKWPSDEPLRASMTTIRDTIEARLPSIHRGEFSAAQYAELGGTIDSQVANIVQNCKLEPAADEVLHAILAELIEGNEKLQGRHAKTKRTEGVLQVVRSLEQYGEHFEHAGFAAPKSGH